MRPWRHQSGGLRRLSSREPRSGCGGAAPGALRVAVLHHQLSARRGARASARSRGADPCSHRLAAAGAELIVGGHIHQVAVAERREFAVCRERRPRSSSIAPGLGQPRPHRRGEARGALVYRWNASSISVETYVWHGDDWSLTAVRTFARGRDPLTPTA